MPDKNKHNRPLTISKRASKSQEVQKEIVQKHHLRNQALSKHLKVLSNQSKTVRLNYKKALEPTAQDSDVTLATQETIYTEETCLVSIINHIIELLKQHFEALPQKTQDLGSKTAFYGMDVLLQCCDVIEAQLNQPLKDVFKEEYASKTQGITNQGTLNHLFFKKARGYAGDFEMMEKIWAGQQPKGQQTQNSLSQKNTSEFVYDEYVNHCANAKANGYRVHYFAGQILQVTGDVALIGSGSAIEIGQAATQASLMGHRFHLYDQETEALAFVQNKYQSLKAKLICKSGSIFKHIFSLPKSYFSLCYSSGLFDYLTLDKAKKLVRALWESVDIGGRLIITNAAPTNPSKFYMEQSLDWYLIYKTESEMYSLADGLDNIGEISCHKDPYGVYLYLELKKTLN